jgi:hypothetical protein
LWISSDEAEECERCGEPFGGRPAGLPLAAAAGSAIKAVAALFVVGVLGGIVVQRFGVRFPDAWAGVNRWWPMFYAWLMGPDEIYKPYLIIMLVMSLLFWLVLWLLARGTNP